MLFDNVLFDFETYGTGNFPFADPVANNPDPKK